jgi:hypothetical protein
MWDGVVIGDGFGICGCGICAAGVYILPHNLDAGESFGLVCGWVQVETGWRMKNEVSDVALFQLYMARLVKCMKGHGSACMHKSKLLLRGLMNISTST